MYPNTLRFSLGVSTSLKQPSLELCVCRSCTKLPSYNSDSHPSVYPRAFPLPLANATVRDQWNAQILETTMFRVRETNLNSESWERRTILQTDELCVRITLTYPYSELTEFLFTCFRIHNYIQILETIRLVDYYFPSHWLRHFNSTNLLDPDNSSSELIFKFFIFLLHWNSIPGILNPIKWRNVILVHYKSDGWYIKVFTTDFNNFLNIFKNIINYSSSETYEKFYDSFKVELF